MTSDSFANPELLRNVKAWENYYEAKLGFRNHWYPCFNSSELREGEPKTVRLLGENIILNRVDGVVYALRDRCIHRGVKLSIEPNCYTKNTISCWYHGYTYRWRDGVLCDIVASPTSKLINNRKVKVYPVTEAKGIVFVFVGDEGFVAPPLVEDCPPGFLDPDVAVRGIHRIIKSNWRLGAENGFDSTHVLVHKNSPLLRNNDMAIPLGLGIQKEVRVKYIAEPGGPKGVYDFVGPGIVPVFEGFVEGKLVLRAAASHGTTPPIPHEGSLWLPGVLKVAPWPDPRLAQYEWYVPVDVDSHIYFQTIGCKVSSPDEEKEFDREFNSRWVPQALHGFNDDDVWAREATEPFYADDYGWVNEQLFEPDHNLIAWRKHASQHCRGVQRPSHLR